MATVEVKLGAGGTIVGKRLVKSDAVEPWDDAVLRAIERTQMLPREIDDRVPPPFQIDFRLRYCTLAEKARGVPPNGGCTALGDWLICARVHGTQRSKTYFLGASMRKVSINAVAAAVISLCAAGSASAAVVSLNFEGINATYPSSYANIAEFYNGGTSSDGTTGTNYGISFGSNALAICLNSTTVFCSNTSRGGLAPGSDKGGLFFLDGAETFMNVAAGFTTGFSFNYVSVSFAGAVNVYDGANGTGTILATLNLTPNAGSCPGYSAGFCPFSASGVNFAGTAYSVGFAGVANQIVFDDVTFGSSVPGIPEPETYALMLAGLATVAGIARRRKASV